MICRLIVNILLLMNQKKQSLSILSTTPLLRENKDLLTPLKQELLILDNGLEDLEMDMESKFGQMEPGMKVSSRSGLRYSSYFYLKLMVL